MRNPLRKLFGKSSSTKSHGHVVSSRGRSNLPHQRADTMLYAELDVIWPNGTWNMAQYPDRKAMDNVARSVILDTAWFETLDQIAAVEGRPINPGWISRPDEIKPGWKPSEAYIKSTFAMFDWDVAVMHYMVGQLTHLGNIRP
ncbi:MAG: hypothetical protein JO290_03085 [Sphingomonadaceae bacterium]|nr:hypothetical protein [Sphingomonadaceae bacterium]